MYVSNGNFVHERTLIMSIKLYNYNIFQILLINPNKNLTIKK